MLFSIDTSMFGVGELRPEYPPGLWSQKLTGAEAHGEKDKEWASAASSGALSAGPAASFQV